MPLDSVRLFKMYVPQFPISWYVGAALALGLLVTSVGWSNTHKELIKEQAAHAADVQRFKDTQEEANRKAEAKRVELEKKAEKNVEEANKRYDSLYIEYRANLLRFKANQSGGGRPYSGDVQAPKSSNGPSASTNLLTISMSDANICAINTARLITVREWALDPPH